MATSAERMRAHRERARHGLRRFTINVSADASRASDVTAPGVAPVLAHRLGGIADIGSHVVLGHFGGANVLEEFRLLGQAFPGRPGRLELARRLDRSPFGLGNDAEEAPLAHDLDHTGDAPDRCVIHGLELGADGRRPHHARVQHARHAEVMHVSEFAGHLVRNINARNRGADDLVGLRVLGRRRFLVVERQRKVFPPINSP